METLKFVAVDNEGHEAPGIETDSADDVLGYVGRVTMKYGVAPVALDIFDGDRLIGFIGIAEGHNAEADLRLMFELQA